MANLIHITTKRSFKPFHHVLPTTTMARSIRRNIYLIYVELRQRVNKFQRPCDFGNLSNVARIEALVE